MMISHRQRRIKSILLQIHNEIKLNNVPASKEVPVVSPFFKNLNRNQKTPIYHQTPARRRIKPWRETYEKINC